MHAKQTSLSALTEMGVWQRHSQGFSLCNWRPPKALETGWAYGSALLDYFRTELQGNVLFITEKLGLISINSLSIAKVRKRATITPGYLLIKSMYTFEGQPFSALLSQLCFPIPVFFANSRQFYFYYPQATQAFYKSNMAAEQLWQP